MNPLCSAFIKNLPWLLFLLLVDAFAALLLWLADVQAFKTLLGIILLFSILLFTAALLFAAVREGKKEKFFLAFLAQPDRMRKEQLLDAVTFQERQQLEKMMALLQTQQMQLSQMKDDLHDYEEYVEGWAHEIKAPLSLLTMLLDNRQDELPPELYRKLNYVRSQLQEDVTQMLYYARLKSSTKDYRFQHLRLGDLVEEVLEDSLPLLEEKEFQVQNSLLDQQVFTDSRGLRFILGQIISNSIKYADNEPELHIYAQCRETETVLRIRDNGPGVKQCDLPYIFQKGFTGDSTDSQKKATGMGLYLAKKMADHLNLKIEAHSTQGEGFEAILTFPVVSSLPMVTTNKLTPESASVLF